MPDPPDASIAAPRAKIGAAAAARIVIVISSAINLFITNLREGNGNECATKEGTMKRHGASPEFLSRDGNYCLASNISATLFRRNSVRYGYWQTGNGMEI